MENQEGESGSFAVAWKLAIVSAVLAFATSCVTTPPSQDTPNGALSPATVREALPTPPSGYEAKIKDAMYSKLKDPLTAIYRFKSPRRGYLWLPEARKPGKAEPYWFVEVGVLAKNSFGAYSGETTYIFGVKEDRVFDMTVLLKVDMIHLIE